MGRRLVGLTAAGALAASAVALGAAAPASAAPIPVGSISGVVTGPTGAPVVGASVYAIRDVDGNGTYFDDADFFESIGTGLAGDYAFDHLPDGNYLLDFSAPGLLSEYYNDATTTATATPVTVAGGAVAVPAVGLAADTTTVVVDADTDVTGTITNAVTGAPIPGASVSAYNATTGAYITGRSADVNGAYELDSLDPAVPVKLSFSEFSSGAALDYTSVWSGGARSKGSAAVITLTPGTPIAASGALTPMAGITGKVLNPAGAVPYGASVVAYDADTNPAASASVRPDGTYYLTNLNPGESYKLQFSGYDYINNDNANDTHYYLDTWYGGSNDYPNAETLVAGAAGAYTPGIDVTFSDSLTAIEQPSIEGDFLVGKALTANPGRWTKNAGSVFTYEWLRGDTVVATGGTYAPVAGDAGKKLGLRVTNNNLTNGEERVATVTVAGKTVKFMPKVKAKAKGGALKITLKADGQKAKKIKGKVTVKQGKATVGKAKVKKGKATIVLKGKFAKKGKHKFTIKYNGNKTTAAFEKKVKVKVKR
jgi:hypothetical protein